MGDPERIGLIGKRVLDRIERRCRQREAREHRRRRQAGFEENLFGDSPTGRQQRVIAAVGSYVSSHKPNRRKKQDKHSRKSVSEW